MREGSPLATARFAAAPYPSGRRAPREALDEAFDFEDDPSVDDLWPASAEARVPSATAGLVGRRIIVATDFSGTADSAWQLALRLSQRTGALLHLVHVLDGFREIFAARNDRVTRQPDAVLADIQRALAARAVPALDRGVAVLSSSLVGAPGPELVRHTHKTHASLLLLPVRDGGSGPFGAGLGVSTLNYVLARLPPSMVSVVTGPA